MFLLVGLGNPGSQYEKTRHNAGFLFFDDLFARHGLTFGSERFRSCYFKGRVFGSECVVLKPQTFMNLSGRAVSEAMAFFKIPSHKVVVVFDDVDQAPGAVRMRVGGGHGGHNGVRDILAALGNEDFARIKIGIGKPSHKNAVPSWVLSPFSEDELAGLYAVTFLEAEQRLLEYIKRVSK